MDARREADVLPHEPTSGGLPRIEAALGDREHPAHDPYRVVGLVRLHESEERFGVAELSFANQAVAFDRISRSILSCRFSRRRRVSS